MQKLFQPAFSSFARNFTKATKITSRYSTSSKSIHTNTQYRFLTSNARSIPTGMIVPAMDGDNTTKNKSNTFKYAFAAVATLLALYTSSSSLDSYAYNSFTDDKYQTYQDQIDALAKMNCSPKVITNYLLKGFAIFQVVGLTLMLSDVGAFSDICGEDTFLYNNRMTEVTPETFLSREPVVVYDKEVMEEAKQGLIPISLRTDLKSNELNRILSLRVYMEYNHQAIEQISSNTDFNAELIKTMEEFEPILPNLVSLDLKERDEAFKMFFPKIEPYLDYVRPRLVLMYLGEIEGGKLKSGQIKEVLYDSKSFPLIYGFEKLQLYYDQNSKEYVRNYNTSDVKKRFKL